MRSMMFVKRPGDHHVGEVPPALFAAMGEFIEEETRTGVTSAQAA